MDIVSFKNRSDKKPIEENNDYQTVLIENNIYKNGCRNKNNKSNVNNDYSNVKQTNLLEYTFTIDKKLKCEIMGNNEPEIEQVSDLTNERDYILPLKPME